MLNRGPRAWWRSLDEASVAPASGEDAGQGIDSIIRLVSCRVDKTGSKVPVA